MNENDRSFKIIETSLELHKNIGPELLESTYENALAYGLRKVGLVVKQQVRMPFVYKLHKPLFYEFQAINDQ